MQKWKSHSEDNTVKIARTIANQAHENTIFCLHGDLGAGKTTLARAFIQHLTSEETEVPSPTFTLVQTYSTQKGPLWHFDLYRLENADEIYELGWEEALHNAIILIEWPERLGNLIPARRTNISIETSGPESRIITLENHA